MGRLVDAIPDLSAVAAALRREPVFGHGRPECHPTCLGLREMIQSAACHGIHTRLHPDPERPRPSAAWAPCAGFSRISGPSGRMGSQDTGACWRWPASWPPRWRSSTCRSSIGTPSTRSTSASTSAALTVPIGIILAYGGARVLSLAFGELRDALFARVGQRAIRTIAMEVFRHLHFLSLGFHLSRQTGGLSRSIERGTKAIEIAAALQSLQHRTHRCWRSCSSS